MNKRLPTIRHIIAGAGVALFWVCAFTWLPPTCLFLALLAVMLVCAHEYGTLLKRSGMEVSRKFLMIAGTAWLFVCFAFPHGLEYAINDTHIPKSARTWGDFPVFMLLVELVVVLLFVRVLFDPRVKNPFIMLGTTALGFFYIPFMMGFFVKIAQWGAKGPFELTRDGIVLAAFVALVTKAGDVGSYVSGMRINGHKMFPRVSSKRSWEGLLGGLVLSAAAGAGFVTLARTMLPADSALRTLRGFGIGEVVVVSVALCAVGVLGDLVESQLKRTTHTKDSSAIFPGFGGVLDVFDSLTFTPAAFFYYLMIVNYHV
jgi:phosphatidate cytidylyltransferase